MTSQLLIIGGFIFVSMGIVHGLLSVVDVVRPTHFAPVDDSVRLAMKSTNVRFLRARANVWDAWLGFNISHDLGMFMFGAAAVWLGFNLGRLEVASAVLALPPATGALYFLLSVRFWFYAAAIASAVATVCFVAAWWSY